MAKRLTTLSVLGLVQLLTMPTIGAQAVRNLRERSANQEQIEQLRQWLERDQQEVAAFKELATELDANAAEGNAARLTSLRDSLIEVVQRELAQTKERGEFAKTQLQQSSRELRSERRDVRRARDAVDDNQDLAEVDLVRNTPARERTRRLPRFVGLNWTNCSRSSSSHLNRE